MNAARMRPLAEMPVAVLADVPGVACDLDDTVTTKGVLTTAALAALHALADAGVPCVLATGRPLGWAEVLARTLPVRAVVTENGGAWVLREGNTLRVAFAEPEAVRAQGMARVEATVQEITARVPALGRVRDLTLRATDVALDVNEAAHVSRADVERAVAIAHARGLHTVVSTVHLHVSARTPDKVAGLRGALADAGLEPAALTERWIYVGDSPNDASAFAAFARSVGVANVRDFADRMSAWPMYVTENRAGAGFAELVSRLLAAQGRAR